MFRKILTAVALVALAPAASTAQTTVMTEQAIRYERAEILAQDAWLIATRTADFEKAAIQLREAAGLWGIDYPAVRALHNAGRFQYYANRKLSAVSTLRAAGETAERIGDLGTASRAYRDAAWIAVEIGEIPTARTLLEKADLTLSRVAMIALGTSTDR